jgi:hypothetical protein
MHQNIKIVQNTSETPLLGWLTTSEGSIMFLRSTRWEGG